MTAPNIIEEICSPGLGVDLHTLEQVLWLAVEIAREGREGRKVGTIFVIGDSEQVLRQSRCMILDPLAGHDDSAKRIDNPNMRETIKELAQLDGGFVVSDSGVVLSAARYFDASSANIRIPMGLGSRHMAGASITLSTDAVAVVVSESSIVRVMDNGVLISEIIPELWLLRHHGLHLSGPDLSRRTEGELTVVRRTEEDHS